MKEQKKKLSMPATVLLTVLFTLVAVAVVGVVAYIFRVA